MLSAVTSDAPGYEGLRNYIIGGGRPTAVRSLDGNGVRQPMGLPNGLVPGVQQPIPTSSARPGKMTNQRIVYSRVQTQFPKGCGAIDLIPVSEGDVVFVHRHDGKNTQGHDHARVSRVATVGQLNRMLGSYGGDAADVGDIVMPGDQDPRGVDSDDPAERWQHCKLLGSWVPDGVLASKEHDCVMDVTNPGEVYNIAIAGPTLLRNSDWGDYPQHFDDGVRALDKLFLGLVAAEKREKLPNGAYGRILHYTYRFKLFTSRQLLWTDLGRATAGVRFGEANALGGNNSLGPTADEYARMVQVWRVGSVVDTKSGMMPYKCATLNVVIEEWPLAKVRDEFNRFFGESLSLVPVGDVDVAAVLATAARIIQIEGDSLAQGLETLSELYEETFRSETAQWSAADRAHADDVNLADLRGVDRPPDPVVGTVEGELSPDVGYNGQRFYSSPSARIKAFYATFRQGANWCATCRALFLQPRLAELSAVGRTASFRSNSALMEWIATQGSTQIVQDSVALHTVVMALQPIIRLGEQLLSNAAWRAMLL